MPFFFKVTVLVIIYYVYSDLSKGSGKTLQIKPMIKVLSLV